MHSTERSKPNFIIESIAITTPNLGSVKKHLDKIPEPDFGKLNFLHNIIKPVPIGFEKKHWKKKEEGKENKLTQKKN